MALPGDSKPPLGAWRFLGWGLLTRRHGVDLLAPAIGRSNTYTEPTVFVGPCRPFGWSQLVFFTAVSFAHRDIGFRANLFCPDKHAERKGAGAYVLFPIICQISELSGE